MLLNENISTQDSNWKGTRHSATPESWCRRICRYEPVVLQKCVTRGELPGPEAAVLKRIRKIIIRNTTASTDSENNMHARDIVAVDSKSETRMYSRDHSFVAVVDGSSQPSVARSACVVLFEEATTIEVYDAALIAHTPATQLMIGAACHDQVLE